MTIQRLYATLALAAAALLVAGCGGGIRKLQNLILPGILTATMGLVLAGCSSGSDDNGGGSPPRGGIEIPAPPGGGGTPDPEDDDGTTLPVSDMLGVAGVTVTIERPTAENATITAMKGMEYGTDSATVARTIAPWRAEAFRDDATTETARIAVYTDIDTAAQVIFHMAKGIESGAPYTLMSEDASVVMSGDSDFPADAGNSFTWFDDPETETDEREFAGSLMGVDGTFKCMSNPCTASRNAEDELMLSSGWTFTPTDPTSTIPVGDKDFLAFGYWNKVTADGPKDIMPFAYGSMPWAGDIEELSGSASYTGNAAGGYSHHTFDPATGKANDPTYGHFTATAILNAYFGGEEGSNIYGIVSEFGDTSADDTLLTGWRLELMRTDVTERRFSGTTTGGGMWNGAFYGPGDAMPTGAAGTFDGAFNNGAVKGAFGATR